MIYYATILASLALATYIAYNPSTHPQYIVTPIVEKLSRTSTTIVIFIHGATHIPLVFLSPHRVLTGQFDGTSWYEQAHSRIRGDIDARKTTLMLDLGLMEITDSIYAESLRKEERHQAAYHIIRAFSRMNLSESSDVQYRFFTFGWSGSISSLEHYRAAEELYQALIQLQESYIAHKIPVRFEIHAYSHGGQVALNLAHVNRSRSSLPLTIDLLTLSGVPLHHHNTRHILLGTFNTIINIYSEGDPVQTIDYLTAEDNTAFRTIAEATPLPVHSHHALHIIDLVLTIHQQPLIGHQAFFNLHSLTMPLSRTRRSSRYIQRYHPITGIYDALQAFPLLVLYPQIIPPLYKYIQGYAHIHLNITATPTGAIQAQYSILSEKQLGIDHYHLIDTSPLNPLHQERDSCYADTYAPTTITYLTQETHRAFASLLGA